MEAVSEMLNGPAVVSSGRRDCALSIDCQEISCETIASSSFGRSQFFELILLPCLSPPAVRITFSGSINYDRIFYQSREDLLYDFNYLSAHLNVTLDHLSNDSIGLEVSTLYI